MKKIGLLCAGILLVGLLVHGVFGATTPNSIITTQTVSTSAQVIATGDQTTPALLHAAGANGEKIYKVLVYPDTDGTSGDREITLYVYNGSTSCAICLTDITGDSAADVIPVDVLANVPLPLDSNGNKYLELPSGYSLYISAESMTGTNPVVVLSQSY
jgi:hypothetical protein